MYRTWHSDEKNRLMGFPAFVPGPYMRSHAVRLASFATGLGVALVHANKLRLGGYLAQTARRERISRVSTSRRLVLLPLEREVCGAPRSRTRGVWRCAARGVALALGDLAVSILLRGSGLLNPTRIFRQLAVP